MLIGRIRGPQCPVIRWPITLAQTPKAIAMPQTIHTSTYNGSLGDREKAKGATAAAPSQSQIITTMTRPSTVRS